MSLRVDRTLPGQPGAAPARVAMTDANLEVFYRQTFLPLVRRATWKHGLSKDDARDIVQDAFVLGMAKLDAARNPRAWLIQVVDLLALNHQRKAARRAQLAMKWGTANRCEHGADESEAPEC